MKDKNCIFCKIAKGEIKSDVIVKTNNFIAFLDAHPKAEGHTLIVPKRHFVTLLDIPDNLASEMLNLTKKVASDLLDEKKGNGFNIVMNNLECAGQIVKHVHLHVIPRKEGDGLKSLA